jgi:hypothetical protein
MIARLDDEDLGVRFSHSGWYWDIPTHLLRRIGVALGIE